MSTKGVDHDIINLDGAEFDMEDLCFDEHLECFIFIIIIILAMMFIIFSIND